MADTVAPAGAARQDASHASGQPQACTTRIEAGVNEEAGTKIRELFPFIAGIALLALAVFAIQSLVGQGQAARLALQADLRDQLEDAVTDWESQLKAELNELVAQLSDPEADLSALQDRLRGRHAILDSVYVWRSAIDADPAQTTTMMTFPLAATTPDQAIEDHPCVAEARAKTAEPAQAPVDDAAWQAATIWRDGCREAPLAVQVFAANQAAEELRKAGQYAEGLLALSVPGVPNDLGLTDRPGLDVSIRLRALRQMVRAELLALQGRKEAGAALAVETGRAIARLDAPHLPDTLFLLALAIDLAETAGKTQQANRLRQDQVAAETRVAAWREVQRSTQRLTPRRQSDPPRFVVDPYGDAPFVLYYDQFRDGRRGVALQLKDDELIRTLVGQARLQRLADAVVVLDGGRRPLASADRAELSVPLPDTLQRLSLGLRDDAVDERLSQLQGRNVVPIIITLACVLLGLGALGSLTLTNRQHRLLLQRQREFTQRVTHELKTPLAGMKVMAENLALGAWRTDHQRDAMAQRIVEEADRLTERVNEILAFSKQRTVAEMTLFDPEEPLLEVVDMWGPRFDQMGVKLTVDMDPTDRVLGDAVAFRDAMSCLLDNALKYRREDLPSEVWLTLRQEGQTLEVEVVDNGLGVPQEHRKAIFGRFVRVEGPNRGKSGGHGLGLAQVQEIVRRHKGTIQCHDGMDGGARFTLRLPARA